MIPKIIHQIWVGSPMPDHLRAYTDRWRVLHPDWEYRLWTESDLTWLHNSEPFVRAHELVRPYRVGQLRADIARYEILHRHGGFYADTDTEPLRPIDDALHGLTELAVAEFGTAETAQNVGNTYIATPPNAPVLSDVIAHISADWPTWRRQRRLVPANVTGPAVLSRYWFTHGCHVESSDRWFPYTYADVVTGEYPRDFATDVYAVHHWEHIREIRRLGVI